MKIRFIGVRDELRSCVKSIWVVESPAGMPESDMSLAAPNGCSKLIYSCENSIISTVEGKSLVSPENGLYFIGTRDIPVRIATPPRKTTFIGIEFHPQGAYPVFGIPMADLANRFLRADVPFGKWGRAVNDRLPELETIGEKADYLQDRLAANLRRRELRNPVVDRCVDYLRTTDGLAPVSRLESETGYTRRYLEVLFREHVGYSPKSIAEIFRFQKFYRKWARNIPYEKIREELYRHYYDQSHFVREFKRMTGFSPLRFTAEISNEFGRRLSIR